MTIQSDIWIESQCKTPTHVLLDGQDRIVRYVVCESNQDISDAIHNRLPGTTLVKADALLLEGWKPMIHPFEPNQIRKDEMGGSLISYGNSSFGYDVRCGMEFEVFTNVNGGTVDPKNFDKKMLHRVESDVCIIPPNSFALARTVEWFKIPRDVLVVCLGKSTYARCGIIVNVTPLEPEWEGQVTLEFSNTTTLPAKIYANEGVAQMLFLKGNEPCRTSYKDRAGKYQGQSGVTLPRS
ncbi:Deoxycytidine triphosphate deaminase [compost metagenome]